MVADSSSLFRPTTAEADGTEAVPFEPGRLFDLLDADGSGFLSEKEFYAMFLLLDLNISESKQQMMFAYADAASKGLDNQISRDEFMSSWAWLESVMATSIAESLGLGDTQLAYYIALLAVLLFAVLAFVLVAIVAFNTHGGFVAVVQSTIIAGAGFISKDVVRKPKAEELAEIAPKELKARIKAGIRSDGGG